MARSSNCTRQPKPTSAAHPHFRSVLARAVTAHAFVLLFRRPHFYLPVSFRASPHPPKISMKFCSLASALTTVNAGEKFLNCHVNSVATLVRAVLGSGSSKTRGQRERERAYGRPVSELTRVT